MFSITAQNTFQELVKCREKLCGQLGLNIEDVELSMGMSSDYQHAVSTSFVYHVQGGSPLISFDRQEASNQQKSTGHEVFILL